MSNIAIAQSGGSSADSGGPNGKNGGRLSWSGGNESHTDSYDPDPPMQRVGMPIQPNGGGGGCWAADDLPDGPNGRRVQMTLWHFEQSEQARGQQGNRMACGYLHLNAGTGEGDGDMAKCFGIEPRTGVSTKDGSQVEAFYLGEHQWESLIRQFQLRAGGGGPVPPNPNPPSGDAVPTHGTHDNITFFGSGDRFAYARQGDGHDVLYLVVNGQLTTPLWVSDGGPHGTWLV